MNIRVVRGTVKQYSGVSLYKHVLGFVYCLLCVWQRFLYLYAPLTLTWNLNSDIKLFFVKGTQTTSATCLNRKVSVGW